MAEKSSPIGPWGPYPANGGSGGVVSVTGAAPGIVDNTDPANPVVQAQFGSDTTVNLPNAASTPVPALELIATLTDNVVGSEVSQWAIKLLNAGIAAIKYILAPDGLSVPPGSIANPGFNFINEPGSGFVRQGVHDLRFIDQGVSVFSYGDDGASITGIRNLVLGGRYDWATASPAIKQGGPNFANLIAEGGPTGNVEIGDAGILAANATAGFLGVPALAGPPTGTVLNVSAGKIPMGVDPTADKVWFEVSPGVWKGVVIS